MPNIQIRPASAADLEQINVIIAAAIGTWSLPARVRRLALPSYQYDDGDLSHLDMTVATSEQAVVAIAACEPAASRETPAGASGLLLHGLYVHPDHAGTGFGRALFEHCCEQAGAGGHGGLLVKATRDSASYFEHLGMQPVPVSDPQRDYALRYWRPLSN